MQFLRMTLVSAAVAFSAFAVAGGSGAHSHDHGAGQHEHSSVAGKPGSAQQVKRTIDVTMSDNMRFNPSRITVKKGETVRFIVRNAGQIPHEFVLGSAAELKAHAAMMRQHPNMKHEDPNAVTVAPGKTGELIWTFTTSGNVDVACLIPGHFEAGMVGQVAVK